MKDNVTSMRYISLWLIFAGRQVMEMWLIGIAVLISTIAITYKMNNGKQKNDMFASIFIGMWVVVLIVLAVVK